MLKNLITPGYRNTLMARAVGRLKKPRNAGWRALDMEPRAHHLLVGLFTLIVAVAAVVFSLWMTKAGRDSAVKEYQDRKSTRLNSSHVAISYAVFCLEKK